MHLKWGEDMWTSTLESISCGFVGRSKQHNRKALTLLSLIYHHQREFV